MELVTAIFAMVLIFFLLIFFLAFISEAFSGRGWNYYYYSDWHFWHRREEKLQDEINDLRNELRTKQQPPPPVQQAVTVAPPPKQIVEHRHVHVHVAADGQPINAQKLLAPSPVQAKAQELHGTPVPVPGGWNIERNGKVLLEMRKPPANRMIEMK